MTNPDTSMLVTSSPLNRPRSKSDNNALLSEQLCATGCLWSESEPTIASPLSPHRLSCSQQSLPLEYNSSTITSSHSTCGLEERKEQFASSQLNQESYSLHSLPLQTKLPVRLSTKSCWTLDGPSVPPNVLRTLRVRHKDNPSLTRSRSLRCALTHGELQVQLFHIESFTFLCVCNQDRSRYEPTRRSVQCCPTHSRSPRSESFKSTGGIIQRVRSFLSSRRKTVDQRSAEESNSSLRSDHEDSLEPSHMSGSLVGCNGLTQLSRPAVTSRGTLKNLANSRVQSSGFSNNSDPDLVVTCDQNGPISIAAKHAIDRLRQELRAARWDDSQCQILTDILTELASLIPCAQFATEFIKASGHEVIFRLVETFQPQSDQTPSSPTTQQSLSQKRSSVWSALMACLAELAEYGINSADDEFGCELRSTVRYSWDSSIQANYPISVDENDGNLGEDASFVCPVFNPTANELFSWHLVSDLFLSVIIHKCSTECNMVTLKNELKVLMKILINCPARANAVIDQTGPEFVFDRLQTVHELTLDFGNKNDSSVLPMMSKGEYIGNHTSSNRSSVSSTEGSTFWISGPIHLGHSYGSNPEYLPDWCNNPLRNELISLLLEFVYVVLYRAHVNGQLSVTLSDYLNSNTLPRLVSYLPQLRIHHASNPVENESNWNGRRGSTLKRQANTNANPSTIRRDSSHRGASNFFYQTGSLSKQDACKSAQLSSSSSAAGPNPLIVLARLQRLHFALLAEEARTMVDLENPSIREQIRHWLLQACASDRTYLPLIDEQLPPLKANSQPPSPTESTINPGPQIGRLQLNCLRAFLVNKAALVPQILSCGRSRSQDSIGLRFKASESLDRIVDKQEVFKHHPSPNTLSNAIQPDVRRKTDPDMFLDHSSDNLAKLTSGTQWNKPMFPLIDASGALTRLLCHLLAIDGHVEPFSQTMVDMNESFNRFHPMFFQPRTREMTAFEDLFVISMCVFFYAWTQLNAIPEDLNEVLHLLREQLLHVIHQRPVSLDEFEQLLNQRTPQVVLAEWKDCDQIKRDEMQQSHPVLKDLNAYLTVTHQDHVREQRLNAMAYSAPLEYTPQKGQRQQGRDAVKYQVFLSPERNSLILYDQKQCTRDLWPLACIDRVTTGTEERIKKNPERTIVLRVTIRDTSEQDEWSVSLPSQPGRSHTIQPQLVARTNVEYNYWIDGLYILRMVNRPSEQFAKDIQRLVALDMKLRISGLDLSLLPSKPRKIPLDPPEFDFDQP